LLTPAWLRAALGCVVDAGALLLLQAHRLLLDPLLGCLRSFPLLLFCFASETAAAIAVATATVAVATVAVAAEPEPSSTLALAADDLVAAAASSLP
jgi:hypothetical protein